MNRKRVLAACALVALLSLAGCSSALGPQSADQNALTKNATYHWQSNANASINVTGGQYKAVYDVDNRSQFVVRTRDTIGREHPLPISALEFRYPNGTVVGASSPALDATDQRKQTVISLPARNGTLAFTAPSEGKRFSTRTFVKGTYEVTIPQGMRVGYQPLARVSPAGYQTERTATNRVRIRWQNVQTDSVVVRYYLARDLYIFGAAAVVLVLIALVGALYYLRQIRELERRRRDASPNADAGDDSDDGPGL